MRPLYLFLTLLSFVACESAVENQDTPITEQSDPKVIVVEAEGFIDASSSPEVSKEEDRNVTTLAAPGWLAYSVPFTIAGRYKVEVIALADQQELNVQLEDYFDNTDGRNYNVTGTMFIPKSSNYQSVEIYGSPFNTGTHLMKLHLDQAASIDKIVFTLLKEHQPSPEILTQATDGDEWSIMWADEFDQPTIDTNKWTYDFGNWGWGNNELQYYTAANTDNARIENGHLIIEARKNSQDNSWTSARLTTRGKISFRYGKIEFRAIVPRERGNWAAGWTLGNEYVDEKSWPYCGEIDILESVGYELDDESGNGIAHATVHTPAYYFKINNQISSTLDVAGIANDFHTYSVEWTPKEVRAYVDGQHYYTYDKNANELEWPFDQPQNIILNLAMGGGWGGAQGMDPNVTSQQFIIDYVRVYGTGHSDLKLLSGEE